MRGVPGLNSGLHPESGNDGVVIARAWSTGKCSEHPLSAWGSGQFGFGLNPGSR